MIKIGKGTEDFDVSPSASRDVYSERLSALIRRESQLGRMLCPQLSVAHKLQPDSQEINSRENISCGSTVVKLKLRGSMVASPCTIWNIDGPGLILSVLLRESIWVNAWS